MTKLNDEQLSGFATASDLKEMWPAISHIHAEHEGDIEEEEYNKIKNGISIKFDINDYVHDNIIQNPVRDWVKIGNEYYNWHQFMDEIDDRTNLSRNIILNCLNKDDSIA